MFAIVSGVVNPLLAGRGRSETPESFRSVHSNHCKALGATPLGIVELPPLGATPLGIVELPPLGATPLGIVELPSCLPQVCLSVLTLCDTAKRAGFHGTPVGGSFLCQIKHVAHLAEYVLTQGEKTHLHFRVHNVIGCF